MHIQLWGAARLDKKRSGLPVNVWCDDSTLYKLNSWERRIIYQIGEDGNENDEVVGFMTISDNPIVMDWGDTSEKVKQQLRDFVIRNKELLEQLSDMEIDFLDFLKSIKK